MSVDCLYVSIRKEMVTKSCAVYVILGYDVNGIGDILGIWMGESDEKHYWMQIFDEIRAQRVEEDILFINMDGVLGLEKNERSVFKDVVVQGCIIHLIRNSVKCIPSKNYKVYTAYSVTKLQKQNLNVLSRNGANIQKLQIYEPITGHI